MVTKTLGDFGHDLRLYCQNNSLCAGDGSVVLRQDDICLCRKLALQALQLLRRWVTSGNRGGIVALGYHPQDQGCRHIACANKGYFKVIHIFVSWLRGPKMSVPMRTMVEPDAMAASRSADMPSESVSISAI